MGRQEILKVLKENAFQFERFGVKSLAIFGSCARDEMREDSDVDILVQFQKPVGLFEFVRLKNSLEELLGRRVDLVTPDALKAQIKEQVLKEAIHAG